MSDSTSPMIFRHLFVKLAQDYVCTTRDLDPDALKYMQEVAEHMWKDTWNYDFHPRSMDCTSSLCILGLARRTSTGIEYRTRQLDGWE